MCIPSSFSAAPKSRSAASLAPLKPYNQTSVSQLPCIPQQPIWQGSCNILLIVVLHITAAHATSITDIYWTHLQALERGRQLVPILR